MEPTTSSCTEDNSFAITGMIPDRRMTSLFLSDLDMDHNAFEQRHINSNDFRKAAGNVSRSVISTWRGTSM